MAILPAKILYINISNFETVATWDVDDGTGDPWIGMPYQWRVLLTVTPQIHSSHLTSNPYTYTGLDVKIGDLIATTNSGRFLKIITIEDRNESDYMQAYHVVLEDYNRENTFQADDNFGTGVGQISEGDGLLFELKDGLPVIYPLPASLPSTINSSFIAEIISRFFKVSAIHETYIDQAAHGFFVGNVLSLNDTGFYKANASSSATSKVVGVVTEVPHINTFRFRPIGSVFSLAVEGDNGDTIYLSQTVDGGYTNIKPTSGEVVPLFIKLDDTRVIYTPFSSEGSSGSSTSTQDAFYGYKLILSKKISESSGSAERTAIETPTGWTIGAAPAFSDLSNMSGTINDLVIRHNLNMVHSDIKIIQVCEENPYGYFEVRNDIAYTQARSEYNGGPGRAIMLSNFCNLDNKLIVNVTLVGQNAGEPIVSATTEKFVETITYTDVTNMIIKLTRSPIEVNDSIEFTPFDGTDQEWGVDYTVREVINCTTSSNNGFYICISPLSTAPDGGSFNGSINPTIGIAMVLESGDSGKASYFTIAD